MSRFSATKDLYSIRKKTRHVSNAGSVTGGSRAGENNLGISVLVLVSLMIIAITDISTPLGFSVWILYFIPLFLTDAFHFRQLPASRVQLL